MLSEMGKVNRETEVDPVHWINYNCAYCKNTRTCELYDAIQFFFLKGGDLAFTANTVECPWLRWN
jgi:hypothetical protein